MRATSLWLSCCAALFLGAAAATDPEWDVLPSCALNCTLSVLGSGVTSCEPTDTACLCNDDTYQASVAACVRSACTVKKSLVAKRLGSRQCGIPVTQENDIPALTFLFILTTFVVMVRLTVKFLGHGGGWGLDDWLMLVAFSFSIGLYAVHLWRIYALGFGKNTWDVPFANISKILLAFFANEMLYVCHISVTKISVCFFYLRIFDTSVIFRRFVYPIIGVNILIMVLFIFIIIFQCKPIHLAWTGWAQEEPGTCLDIYKLVLGNGIVNLFMDAVIIGLPIYETTKLKLSRARKLGVVLLFAMGFVLTIVGIVRCILFWRTRSLVNPTVDLMPLGYWSCIETLIAIICACLPDSRFFFMRLVPRFYKSFASSINKPSKSSSKTESYWSLGDSSIRARRQRQQQQHGVQKSVDGTTDTEMGQEEMDNIRVVSTTTVSREAQPNYKSLFNDKPPADKGGLSSLKSAFALLQTIRHQSFIGDRTVTSER